MLGRTLSVKRWLSLVVLTIGVSVVSLPTTPSSQDPSIVIHDTSDHFFPRSMHELGHVAGNAAGAAAELTKRGVAGLADQLLNKRSASYQGIQEDQDILGAQMNYSIGLTAVLVAAAISGLTGVYFEKVLKDSPSRASVWTRNIQMSFYSLFPALFAGVMFKDGEEIAKHGFFDGYNWIVWTAIVSQAVGGVLVSLCINYADTIAKTFAMSISIIVSCIFSVFFFNFNVTMPVSFRNVPSSHPFC
jgi:UDP-sugar transporter A1/2/3